MTSETWLESSYRRVGRAEASAGRGLRSVILEGDSKIATERIENSGVDLSYSGSSELSYRRHWKG